MRNSTDEKAAGLSCSDELKLLREQVGFSMRDFAIFLGVPKRTIENWEYGISKPPRYVIDLIVYKVQHELVRFEDQIQHDFK